MEDYVKKQLFLVSLLYLGELSVGYMAGWLAPAVPKLQNSDESPLADPISDAQASLLGSVSFLGIIIGAQLAGWLSNRSGRRPSFLLGGIILIGAHLMLIAGRELWILMVGRLLMGAGAGLLFITNLAYITEISSTNVRGVFLTGTGTACATGITLGYSFGPYISFKAMGYLGVFLALLFVAGALCISESPVFYVMKGKEIEAKTALIRLGRNADVEDVLLAKPSVSRKQEWTSIISSQSNRKAMIIATVLLVSQQTGGYAVVLFFGTTIFQSAASSISPAVATIIVGLTQVAASCIAPLFVERVGRKALMLVTTAGCFFTHVILGSYFCLETLNPDFASRVNWVPLVCLVAFILFYTSGFGIIPGTWMSEMLDSSARGPGSATAMAISWIFGFLTTVSFSHMTSTLGTHVTFWVYSLSCAFAFVFTAVVVPETKGKSLTEIQIILIYIGQVLVGSGWTAPVLPKLQDPDQNSLPGIINEQQAYWIGPVLYCVVSICALNSLERVLKGAQGGTWG